MKFLKPNPASRSIFCARYRSSRFAASGSHKYTQINVRILAASNRDLTKLMTEGRFREDLYYRLSVVVINLPGLEERREDIPLLVQHFLKRSNHKSKRNITITDSAVKMLTNASWPGNVRELENLVERLAIFCSSGEIGVADVERERQMIPPTVCRTRLLLRHWKTWSGNTFSACCRSTQATNQRPRALSALKGKLCTRKPAGWGLI